MAGYQPQDDVAHHSMIQNLLATLPEDQQEEIEALESICPGEFEIHPDGPNLTGLLRSKPAVGPEGINVTMRLGEECRTFTVNHLPPFETHFELPPQYPEVSPQFKVISAWLNTQQIHKLTALLTEKWDEVAGSNVLFDWHSLLKEDALEVLFNGNIDFNLDSKTISKSKLPPGLPIDQQLAETGITDDNGKYRRINPAVAHKKVNSDITPSSTLEGGPVVEAGTAGSSAVAICKWLQEYNRNETDRLFDLRHVSCAVCMGQKLGQDSIKFKKCGHSFCKECVSGYFESQIKDGMVKGLNCPEPSCRADALPTDIKKLVSGELYIKYEKTLLEISLSEMTDIVFCPRPHCRQAVVMDPEERNLAICGHCQYSFCTICQRASHGLSPCKIVGENKVLKEYLGSSDEDRQFLKQKYGSERIQKLLDDHETNKYLKENTVPCPSCGTSISKIDGCNKMECYKCRTRFCWLCQQKITSADPYSHFNSGECAGRLFEGLETGGDFWGFNDEDFFIL